MVDRAAAVHGLLAGGKAPAEVQRRLAKSKGYVSVLGYLGAALAGLEPEDLAGLRSPALTPRVVWPLVTRARTAERAAVREALVGAVRDADRDQARRRARAHATVQLRSALRAHVQAAAAGLTAPPRPRGGRRPRAATPVFGALAWDAAAWAADPVAYARAHLTTLAAAHRAVADAAALASQTAAAERVLDDAPAADRAGSAVALGSASLRQLGRLTPERWRALAAELPRRRPAAEGEALALLAGATRALRAALA